MISLFIKIFLPRPPTGEPKMNRVEQLWKCALETCSSIPNLSKWYGLQIYKQLQEDNLELSIDMLSKCCFFCGSVLLPSLTCQIKIVPAKQRKSNETVVFVTDIQQKIGQEKLKKCKNYVEYHCLCCNKRILFRGSCQNEIIKYEKELKSSDKKKPTPQMSKRKDKNETKESLKKKLKSLSAQAKPSYSLKDFLGSI